MKKLISAISKNPGTMFLASATAIASTLPLLLVFFNFTLPHVAQRVEEDRKASVQVAVDSVYNVLEHFHQLEKKGELSKEAAQTQALAVIRDLRYHGNEYFWVNDLTPQMLMHPIKPDLNGKNLSEFKDPKGKKLFVEMVEVASKDGSGFVDYLWAKPGASEPVPKTSFVRLFQPWGWVIGNGVYIDDVQADVAAIRSENLKWLSMAVGFAILISIFAGLRQLFQVVLPIQNSMGQLVQQTKGLAITAEKLETTAGQLDQSVSSQSSALHQTNASIHKMAELTEQTAQGAKSSSSSAEQTRSLAEEGQSSISNVLQGMHEISTSQEKMRDTVSENLSRLNELVQIIGRVSEKTSVINDIVFQTKLLSFNASVEAARAGEHGKGFAVVAEEIGSLARMSGTAAEEITQIIDQSREQVRSLTGTMNEELSVILKDVHAKLEEGKKLADQSRQVLDQVVATSTRSSQMSAEIETGNSHQVSEMGQIRSALEHMEQKNAGIQRAADDTQKFSESLLKQSQELSAVIQALSRISNSRSEMVANSENKKGPENFETPVETNQKVA